MRAAPLLSMEARAALERFVQTAIDVLDADDAAMAEREPDPDDEVISEDDGVVYGLKAVGRQA